MRKEATWVEQIDVEGHIKEFMTNEPHDSVLEFVLELLNLELKYYGYHPNYRGRVKNWTCIGSSSINVRHFYFLHNKNIENEGEEPSFLIS